MAVNYMQELATKSWVLWRGALPISVRNLIADFNEKIDVAVGLAVDGDPNWRELLGDQGEIQTAIHRILGPGVSIPAIMDAVCRPIVGDLLGASSGFKLSPYQGVFVSDPRLPRSREFFFHSDGHYDGLSNYGINFWVPWRTCGRHAPGLRLVNASEEALTSCLDLLPQSPSPDDRFHTTVDWPHVSSKDIEGVFGTSSITEPEVNLGDILVFTNRCIHSTYFVSDMSKGRAASIIRYTLDRSGHVPDPM